MPTLRPGTHIPTDQEDAIIRAGIADDPDTFELTPDSLARLKPVSRIGRPVIENPKQRVSIRLSPEIVDAFRSTGQGWQTRIDAALRQYLVDHPI